MSSIPKKKKSCTFLQRLLSKMGMHITIFLMFSNTLLPVISWNSRHLREVFSWATNITRKVPRLLGHHAAWGIFPKETKLCKPRPTQVRDHWQHPRSSTTTQVSPDTSTPSNSCPDFSQNSCILSYNWGNWDLENCNALSTAIQFFSHPDLWFPAGALLFILYCYIFLQFPKKER